MTYAGQLRVADSELDTYLRACDSDLERWAWLITKHFESAVAALIICRNGRPEQFVAHVCYMHACRHRLQMIGGAQGHWAVWPKSHITFGQYHLAGSSALDVALKFATGLWAEIEAARLWAYPRCSIEDRELSDFAEWPAELRKWLRSGRPELAEWPLWSIHQERDRVRSAIGDEFRAARSQSGEMPQPGHSADNTFVEGADENLDDLSDESLLNFTQRAMIDFFRRWELVPGDDDLLEIGGKFNSSLARPHFDQEFDRVGKCLLRATAIGRRLGVDTVALRTFVEAFRHYDIRAAERVKYDASADMQRLRETLCSTFAAGTESQTDETPELGALLGSPENPGDSDPKKSTAKSKRSTVRGEARDKLIGALIDHHKYSGDSYLNHEPIGCNALALKADVVKSTASDFFKKEFRGHLKYKVACRTGRLLWMLRLLNKDVSPHDLYGADPDDNGDQADD